MQSLEERFNSMVKIVQTLPKDGNFQKQVTFDVSFLFRLKKYNSSGTIMQ